MPRSQGAEAVDYGSLPEYIGDDQDTVQTQLETSPADNDITNNDDILRSQISDALTEIDGLERKIPESSKTLLEKQKEKLMNLMEKGDFDKAKIFSSMVKDSLKAEAKFHEQFQKKREEIDFRLQNGFSEVAGTSHSTLEKVHKLHDRLKNQAANGNFSEAAVLADRILDLFHNEHVNGHPQSHVEQKKIEQRLKKLKDQLSAILKKIPDWREQHFIVQGFEKIDHDEDAGNLEAAGQTIQYLIDSLAGPATRDSVEFASRDEEEATQFLQGVINRLKYGEHLEKPIIPSETAQAKIDNARQEIVELLNEGKAKQARNLAEKLLQTIQKGIPKADFTKKRSRGGDEGLREIRNQFTRTNPKKTLPAMNEQSTLSSGEQTRVEKKKRTTDELPVTEQLDLGDEGTGQFSYDEATQPGLEIPNDENTQPRFELANVDDGDNDEEATIVREVPQRQSVDALAKKERALDRQLEQARARRKASPAAADKAGVFDALSLPPELLDEPAPAPVAEANEPDTPDFDDIAIPQKKGLFASLREKIFGRPKTEKTRSQRDEWMEAIETMDMPIVLENLKKFQIDLTNGTKQEELQKVSELLKRKDPNTEIFRSLWNKYLELQMNQRDISTSKLKQIDVEDVYDKKLLPKMDAEAMQIDAMPMSKIFEQMKKFGIDLDREAEQTTNDRINKLLQLDTKNGEVFKKLYARYVELINNNIEAVKLSNEKDITQFLKKEYEINTKKYFGGDKKEKSRVDLLRNENSQRRRLIDTAITRLENLTLVESPEAKNTRLESYPKTVEGVQKIRTLKEITQFLYDKFGIQLNSAAKVENTAYTDALLGTFDKIKKGKENIDLIQAAISRAIELKNRPSSNGDAFQTAETFVGRPSTKDKREKAA